MATKKATSKKPSSMVKWDAKFAKFAKAGVAQLANIGAGGVSIKFGRGSISIGDAAVKNGVLECVIVGMCALNRFNKAAWDPKNPLPPDCYAFALVADDPTMKPHPAAPNKQAEDCASCDNNVFGSARQGDGKACANTLRLGILTAKDAEDADTIKTADIATAGVSPTNLKHYAKYAKTVLEEHGRPVWAVVTQITSHDDPTTQIRLEFKMVSLIEDDEILGALETYQNEDDPAEAKIQTILQKPFSVASSDKKGKSTTTTGKSKKFASAVKKTARR